MQKSRTLVRNSSSYDDDTLSSRRGLAEEAEDEVVEGRRKLFVDCECESAPRDSRARHFLTIPRPGPRRRLLLDQFLLYSGYGERFGGLPHPPLETQRQGPFEKLPGTRRLSAQLRKRLQLLGEVRQGSA